VHEQRQVLLIVAPRVGAVWKRTPGSVCNAFSGFTPGSTFCISAPDMATDERVLRVEISTVAMVPAGVVSWMPGAGAGASAAGGGGIASAGAAWTIDAHSVAAAMAIRDGVNKAVRVGVISQAAGWLCGRQINFVK
jgi:hypothetical protein